MAQYQNITAENSSDQLLPQSELAIELADAQLFLLTQKAEIKILRQQLASAKASEASLRAESGFISYGNLDIDKNKFVNGFLISLGFFAAVLISLFWKIKRSSLRVREAETKLNDLEVEHEQHIKTALEREQKIRRQLQDEINRRKISDAS